MISEEKVIKVLKKSGRIGLTISELAEAFKTSRPSIRVTLAWLEAKGKVGIRKAGMAKIYYLTGGKK